MFDGKMRERKKIHSLYTIIFDYKGGTYISQLKALDENTALKKWANNIHRQVKAITAKAIKSLNEEVTNGELIRIKTTRNVWITCVLVLKSFSVIHVIKTQEN